MSRIIYEPEGRAREYAPLAANLYTGCPHGCLYCFGPSTLKKKKAVFHSSYGPKARAIERLSKDASKLRRLGDTGEILLSFVTDPYLPEEMDWGITRAAIEVLIANGLHFTILTKGGTRAVRDFDLLANYPKARFGTTIVFSNPESARHYEPEAPDIYDRIQAIKEAHDRGIKTWVSLEPVIFPDQALDLIQGLHHVVDHWKIGKLNGRKPPEPVDWGKFRKDAKTLLDSLEADYYFKNSLGPGGNASPPQAVGGLP